MAVVLVGTIRGAARGEIGPFSRHGVMNSTYLDIISGPKSSREYQGGEVRLGPVETEVSEGIQKPAVSLRTA